MKEGDMVVSLIDNHSYKITHIFNQFAVLNSLDGKYQVFASIEKLKMEYRKIENKMENVENKNR